LLNWGSNYTNSRPRTKVKKATNFRDAVWFLAGMQLHWFLNQNYNLGLDWTNHKLRTNVNSDMFLSPFLFKWNGVFCLKWRRFIHCSLLKNKDPNSVILNGTVGLLLSLDTRSRGRRRFFFLCRRYLSLQKDTDSLLKRHRHHPHLPETFHVLEKREEMCSSGSFLGGYTVAFPASLFLVFPINTKESTKEKGESRGGEQNKREENTEDKVEKRRRKGKEKKQRRKKTEEGEE